jgi:SpoVK/Ycf46/Vps4 family AAA+-type ATPase
MLTRLGDIGDNAGDVQQNLSESFQLAHRWGCVMLLDEADVFLQSRARDRDLSRNAVVSVFLGMLEYYSGILFLTTNKIGTFDEAFKSRIHVSLYYKELDEEQTLEIWRINLQRIKLTREGRITFDEKKMMKWMKKLFSRNERDNLRPWNGRQIRNACQTAAALAEFQNNGEVCDQMRHVESSG